MIPKRTVFLPCSHVLCQSCLAANSQGCGGRCPLDQEPFEEAECASFDLPTRTANALKVHCWNEAHGCEFEGTMEVMLRHYENECTFHTVECLRCGKQVLHRALSTHYVAELCAPVSVAGTKNSSSESGALTLEGITGALQELETLLRNDKHNKLLSAIQCAMNEMFEQIGNQESGVAVFPHNVAAPVKAEMAQIAAPSPSTSLLWETSRQKPTEDASTSAASFLQETTTPHNVAAPVKADMAQVPTQSPSTPLQERTSRHNSTKDASKTFQKVF
ncbi:uncharacterized protein LOC119406280 [Rhipicephalus sanguineus]|uniref:uncharacterized protein LOC119406280 n=1 Tax=Rhipicephalus sanguineus TaxID=34632 RepID=UPI0020C1DFA0|nr:uncharacterized protein LOC119406280 [Rhipicephalus sanguineus]